MFFLCTFVEFMRILMVPSSVFSSISYAISQNAHKNGWMETYRLMNKCLKLHKKLLHEYDRLILALLLYFIKIIDVNLTEPLLFHF